MTILRMAAPCLLVLLLLSGVHGAAAQQTYDYLLEWGVYGFEPGRLVMPLGIARDPSGNTYVADTGNHRVQKFTANGTFLAAWGSEGTAAGRFSSPTDVAVDSAGNILVTDYGNCRIQKFTATGAFLAAWGSCGAGNLQFQGPAALAVDSSGRVYVADELNNRIMVFSSTGAFVMKWGTLGSSQGQFRQPGAISVDATGNVYVGDVNNHRVQKFTSAGTFVTEWGSYGTAEGQFNHPWGIEADSAGSVFVCDGSNNRVQKFTADGTFLAAWGCQGSGAGQFRYSGGVTTDPAGNVYVTDRNNNRVQKFARAGSISIDSAPKGAKVFLDGTDTGRVTPCLLTDIPRGAHTVSATYGVYSSPAATVQVSTGQTVAVFLTINTAPGAISITTVPSGANIFLNGVYQGLVSPATIAGLTPGTYRVHLVRAGYVSWITNVQVTAGVTTPVMVTLTPALKALPGCTSLPTDPDGDGICEDLNGNGRVDFVDPVLYFNQITWIAANEPVAAFDFNRNGRIDFADVVALFEKI